MVRFTEQKNLEIRGEFLNAFNNINFYGTYCTGSSSTCGNITSAWQDTSHTGSRAAGRFRFSCASTSSSDH